MPKTKMGLCEVCFARPASRKTRGGDFACADCAKTLDGGASQSAPKAARSARKRTPDAKNAPRVKAGKPKAPASPPAPKHGLCERCFTRHKVETLQFVGTDLICPKCERETRFKWFAVTVFGSDAKVRRNIKSRFKDTALESKLGRVIIPKTRQMRLTKNRWRAANDQGIEFLIQDGRSGELVYADVSCETEEEAMFLAKQRWGNDQNVKAMRLVKRGGKKLFQNVRAMPGYLLVECAEDPAVFEEIRKAGSVGTVLPYLDPMTFEDLEDCDTQTDPVPIDEEEVKPFLAPPKPKVMTLNFGVGDEVEITGGTYRGLAGPVVLIDGPGESPDVTVETAILGATTEVKVDAANVRKIHNTTGGTE